MIQQPTMTDRKPLTNLETAFSHLLARRHSRSLLRRLTIAPPGTVDFSSNDYLSLSTHPEIRSTFLSLLQAPQPIATPSSITGTSDSNAPSLPPPIGSRGSRLLDGNHPLTVSLESLISTHHRSPSGLLFNSGFDANVGLFSTLPQPSDVIVYDELIHASVHDGMRLSRVAAPRRLAFAHNDMGGLRRVLEGIVGDREVGEKVRAGKANVFVAVEAVYSMDGDVAPLRAMLDLVDEMLPKGNGYVIVDEAHATGVFGGAGGRGLTCELGVEDRVFARVVTFGKALGSQGGESGSFPCSSLPYFHLCSSPRLNAVFPRKHACSQLTCWKTTQQSSSAAPSSAPTSSTTPAPSSTRPPSPTPL